MSSNDPYAVMIGNELEQRRCRAAQARLVREVERGRAAVGPRPTPLSLWPGRLLRYAARMLGLAPAPGVL